MASLPPLETFANTPQTTVSTGGTTAPGSGTPETWTVASSSSFPIATTGIWQFHVEDPALPGELIAVTNVSGTTWTVTRGAEGSTPVAHAAGFTVEQVASAGWLQLMALSALPWFNVLNYGADRFGVNDSTAAFVNASLAVPSTGGVVYAPTGTYRVNTGAQIVNNVTPTYYVGDGWMATQINFYGTGDCFRMLNPAGSGTFLFGGGFHGMTVDGTNAGAGSTGVHAGDSGHLSFDLMVQNFNGAGSMGVHFDNTIWWTEKLKGIIYAHQNTQGVVFDVTGAGAGGSFAYGELTIWLNQTANQDGVVLQNGAYLYHEKLILKGNFAGGATNTGAVLRITGRLTGAGAYSRLRNSELQIQVEANGGAVQHQTIAVGTQGSNVILGCFGMMDFGGGSNTFANSNLSPSTVGGSFTFNGPVNGDTSLNPVAGAPSSGFPTPAYFGAMILPQAAFSGSTGALMSASGDVFSTVLSANITVSLNPATGNQNSVTLAGPQRKSILIQQAAAGGPYTVTWPVNASPTISSPTVVWPGGVAPVMSTAASAVDHYELVTLDGITWYGTAYQSAPPDQVWYSGLISPTTGVVFETFPRDLANSVRSAGTSGTLYARAIPLPAGQKVSNLTAVVGATAEAGGTHGWYALMDNTMKVQAVSADQTGAAVWAANAALTLPMGTPYTTTYSGLYYVGICVVATTMPVFNGTAAMTTGLTPLLAGSSSTAQTTPPTVGTTMAALSNLALANFYAYAS